MGGLLTSSPRNSENPATQFSFRSQAVEVRGSQARHPGRLPAQSRRAPPRCSWPRSRRHCRRKRRRHSETGLGSRGCPLRCARTPSIAWLVNAGVKPSPPGLEPCPLRRRTSRPQAEVKDGMVQPGLLPQHSSQDYRWCLYARAGSCSFVILDADQVNIMREIQWRSSRPQSLAAIFIASVEFCDGKPRWARRCEPRLARASLRWR